MAPIAKKSTRSGAGGSQSGFKGSVHRKRFTRDQPKQKAQESSDDDEELDFNTGTQAPDLDPDQLTDLRDMADRVGEEVDKFAETLDSYNDELRRPASTGYEAARGLCMSYYDYCNTQVKKLRKQTQIQKLNESKTSFSQSSFFGRTTRSNAIEKQQEASKDPAATLESLKQWQTEADTWKLFHILLELHFNPDEQHARSERDAKLKELGTPHRYTRPEDLWQTFLLEYDSAREKHLIVKWLEETADHAVDGSDPSERKNAGLATNGWMETRERVKGAKRMRLGSGQPLNVTRSDNQGQLVTELDPDAPARQKRGLEPADTASEKELWVMCWKMLRQGKSWAEVCEWCLERNQSWRAVSMGVASGTAENGPAASVLWRRMCYIAAHSSAADAYEAAVYGLLSGDVNSVQQVCKSWDDQVFVRYNSSLLTQYDEYILRLHPLQMTHGFLQKTGLAARDSAGSKSVGYAAIKNLLKGRAQVPLKQVQADLITKDFFDLCQNIGAAIGEIAWQDEPSAVIRRTPNAAVPDDTYALAKDIIDSNSAALRVMAHMVIILRDIGLPQSSFADTDETNNIVAAYIQLLRATGKRDLTPIYASKMTESRGVSSLAQVVSDLIEPQEAIEFIKLMELYGIDAVAVLNGQYSYLLDQLTAGEDTANAPPSILETTNEELYPGQKIKYGFLDQPLSAQEEALVNSLTIFYLIQGHWKVTFEALSYSCRKLLRNGHFAAACALVERMQFAKLSQAKSVGILEKPLNVMDRDQVANYTTSPDRAMRIRVLQKESQGFYDLSLLLNAAQALNRWRKVEHEFASKVPRPSSVPSKVKKAYEEVKDSFEPIFSGILLEAKDDQESADFTAIRTLCLPELILAYNTVLCTAGHMISRDELLLSMDLSTIIANDSETGPALAKAFTDSKRMTELVKSFAQTSKIMLKLNETGKPRKEKKKTMGRNLAIWEING